MKTMLFALAASVAAATEGASPSAARHPEVEQAREARIPFVSLGAVRTFRPVGNDRVYLRDNRRNWYLATLSAPCFNLRSSVGIGIDTRFGNTLDHSSSFIVRGERCPIQSLVRVEGPPPRARGGR